MLLIAFGAHLAVTSCCCFALLPCVALHHTRPAQAEALISFGVHASGANISNSVVVAVSSSSSSQAIGDSQDSSQVLLCRRHEQRNIVTLLTGWCFRETESRFKQGPQEESAVVASIIAVIIIRCCSCSCSAPSVISSLPRSSHRTGSSDVRASHGLFRSCNCSGHHRKSGGGGGRSDRSRRRCSG